MEIKDYIKEYCKNNDIGFKNFLIERGVHPTTFSNYRHKFTIAFLLKFDDILNDKPEYRKMVAERIRHKLRYYNEVDIRAVPDEVLFNIYEMLKEYKFKD